MYFNPYAAPSADAIFDSLYDFATQCWFYRAVIDLGSRQVLEAHNYAATAAADFRNDALFSLATRQQISKGEAEVLTALPLPASFVRIADQQLIKLVEAAHVASPGAITTRRTGVNGGSHPYPSVTVPPLTYADRLWFSTWSSYGDRSNQSQLQVSYCYHHLTEIVCRDQAKKRGLTVRRPEPYETHFPGWVFSLDAPPDGWREMVLLSGQSEMILFPPPQIKIFRASVKSTKSRCRKK